MAARCPECGGKMTLDEAVERCEICFPEIESREDELVNEDDDDIILIKGEPMKRKDPNLCEFNATKRQGLTKSTSIPCHCLKASARNVLNGGPSMTATAAISWDSLEKVCPLVTGRPYIPERTEESKSVNEYQKGKRKRTRTESKTKGTK